MGDAVYVCCLCGKSYEDPTQHDTECHGYRISEEPTQREWIEAVATISRAARCETVLPQVREAAQAFLAKYEIPST